MLNTRLTGRRVPVPAQVWPALLGAQEGVWQLTQAWCDGRAWSGGFRVLGGLGEGDVEAEGLDLADVVAELAAGVGAGLVVAVAEVGVAGFGVAEQVPGDDQDGAGDRYLELLGLATL